MARQQITGELFDYDWKKQRYGGTGRTLGSFLAEATNGILALDTPPDDSIRMIDLAPFANEDPDHFLVFTFIISKNGFANVEYGNAIVLDEYEVPDEPEVVRPPIGDGSFLKKYELPPGTMLS